MRVDSESVRSKSGAAFFDLDRTLLTGGSGPVLTQALRDRGLVTTTKSLVEDALFGLFDAVGENRASMVLARLGVRLSKGWDADAVGEAGQAAAHALEPLIAPYARQLIAWHRHEGRKVVMATTSPMTLCRPLGELLGFDDVIATNYGQSNGTYDGTVDGHYVWGPGKLNAVAEWCHDNGIDLGSSYAYSDSRYDLPLLRAVEHPVAVNPDPRLLIVATAKRWPVAYLDVPAGVPKIAGVEPQKAMLHIARPEMVPYARFDIGGTDFVPREGPVIIAANHRSYFDPLAIGFAMTRIGRPVRFLAKKEVVDAPVIGSLVKSLGTIRVDRGSGTGESLKHAIDALTAGEVVVILPEGTIPRGPAFFEPKLSGRPGVARLAIETGAPVVPLGLWGSENVWPRNAKVPAIWNITQPPTVRVRLGAPVDLSKALKVSPSNAKKREKRVLDAVMDAITEQLPDEAFDRGEPTVEELRRTYPSGTDPESVKIS